jgi:hypothetical protein
MAARKSATLVNRRSVAFIDLLFPHEVEAEDGGWQVDALGDGKLVVRFLDGRETSFAIAQGEAIVAQGDDLYLSPSPNRDER